MKKIISIFLIACILSALSVAAGSSVVAAGKYDITVSDGNEYTLQDALDRAKSRGTSSRPYTIHVTRGMMITRSLCVYSNTKLISDKNVVYKRNMYSYDKNVMLRFGYRGSYSSGYKYKNITIQGGIWDGNGSYLNSSFCIFKLAHAQNVKLLSCTFKNDVEGHMVEVGAVKGLTVNKCTFKDHISLDSSYEHEEALQLDVNLKVTTEMGYFDKKQNKNITVTNCTFSNVGRGIGSHNSIEGLYFTNMIFKNNTFKNLKSYAISCVNYRNSKIQNNKILNCVGGIMFMNIKNDYKNCKNSYVINNWGLKLNNSRDNSVISGNYIKQARTYSDSKTIIVFGDQVPYNYGSYYVKGDHCVNGITVSNNTIYTPQYTAMLFNDAKNCKINSNKIYYTGSGNACYGIFLQDKSNGTSLTGNKIYNCYDGIIATDSHKLKIVKNTVKSSVRNGMAFENSKGSYYSGNKIYNSARQGMYFENATGTVSKCTISGVRLAHGISTNTGNCNLKVTGCNISNCKQFGIAVSAGKVSTSKCVFSGNKKGNVYRNGRSYNY